MRIQYNSLSRFVVSGGRLYAAIPSVPTQCRQSARAKRRVYHQTRRLEVRLEADLVPSTPNGALPQEPLRSTQPPYTQTDNP